MSDELRLAIAHYSTVMGVSMKEATRDADAYIKNLMDKKGYSKDFAEATFIEDYEEADAEELDAMEAKAKANKATNVQARKEPKEQKEKKTRTVKEDAEKQEIIAKIAEILAEIDDYSIEIVNKQQKIDLHAGNNHYSITLTKHRAPKEKKLD